MQDISIIIAKEIIKDCSVYEIRNYMFVSKEWHALTNYDQIWLNVIYNTFGRDLKDHNMIPETNSKKSYKSVFKQYYLEYKDLEVDYICTYCINQGFTELLKHIILKYNYHMLTNKENLLYYAAQEGLSEIVGLLLIDKFNPNSIGCSRRTPLHVACYNGHYETVKVLILNGANMEIRDPHGKAPRHIAKERGYKHIRILLIKAKTAKIYPNMVVW